MTDPRPTDRDARLDEAIALYRRCELSAARALCKVVIAASGAGDGPHGPDALEAWYWAVRIERRERQLDEALRLVHSGLAAADAGNHPRVANRLRAELVGTLTDLDQNDQAIHEAEIALRLAAAQQDTLAEAATLYELGGMSWSLGRWSEGQSVYAQMLALAQNSGDPELCSMASAGSAAMEDGLAAEAWAAGEPERAQAHALRGLAFQQACAHHATVVGDRYHLAFSELNLGCQLNTMGRLDDARRVLETCRASSPIAAVRANAAIELGRVALGHGDPQAAIALLQEAIALPEFQNQRAASLLIAFSTLVDAHEAAGDPVQALACMRRYHALHVANLSEKGLMRTRALAVQYETDKAKAVAAAQQARAERLERSNQDLSRTAEQLARASLEDPLTGIANRRRFDAAVQARASHDALQICFVALLDLDHFKRVNDLFSHPVGDAVLRRLAAILTLNCRPGDLAARYGGEEFVLLIDRVDPGSAVRMCERIRAAVDAEPWGQIAEGLAVTVSIGLAHAVEVPGADIPSVIALADARLYAAKAQGRNRVHAGDLRQDPGRPGGTFEDSMSTSVH